MTDDHLVSVPDFSGGDVDLSTPGAIFGSDVETWVVDEQGGWQIIARFDFVEGAPRITHLRMHSANGERTDDVPTGGLQSGTVRSVNFTRLFGLLNEDHSPARFTLAVQGLDPTKNFANVRRPGRRGRADLPYAVWANRYVKMAAITHHPYPALVAEYPDPNPDPDQDPERQIRDIIQRAKRRGLIEGMTQGRAGGRLTPKAKDLLARKGEEPK